MSLRQLLKKEELKEVNNERFYIPQRFHNTSNETFLEDLEEWEAWIDKELESRIKIDKKRKKQGVM